MAYINASTTGNRVKLILIKYDATAHATLEKADFVSAVTGDTLTLAAGAMEVPALQDITINNSNGSMRWKQLDSGSEKVITTAASNSLSGNFVLDATTFFGTTPGTNTTIVTGGIFGYSNARIQVAFMVAPSGAATGQQLIMGTGFIGSLAPKTSADNPVFVSPISIEVNGDFVIATA
jgi:hypothetical protein